MKKIDKILIIIIAVLIIALGITIIFYINANKTANEYLQKLLYSNTILTNYVKAAENADLEFELQEDNSYKLIKRTTPVETIDE